MALSKLKKTDTKKTPRKSKFAEIASELSSLINVFILVLIFITFVMRTFIIPTGSMADTLMGAHFRLRCPQCGYKYNHDFSPERYRVPANTIPKGTVQPPPTRCPNCGYYNHNPQLSLVTKGDKIFVLKYLYQFVEPKRWDVIVFNYPGDPLVNYIKRLVALPGETVEIIDGDVYIDGKISAKPPKVQNELWMTVYDNDYQPIHPMQKKFNLHYWEQPFNLNNSLWTIDKDNPTAFCLDGHDGQVHTFFYDTSIGNNFRATYAYDDMAFYETMPYCSDLMTRLYITAAGPEATLAIALGKYGILYKGGIDLKTREMFISRIDQDSEEILARGTVEAPGFEKSVSVNFKNVDHKLVLDFGGKNLAYDLGPGPDDAGQRNTDIEPEVKIIGSGNLKIAHIAIFRDIHYTSRQNGISGKAARATLGSPLKLDEKEYFVLGDNSPISGDGRWWNVPGRGNNGKTFRTGIVPRQCLVGKAWVVVWPSGYKPFEKFPFRFIPNAGRMRFISGGSDSRQCLD